MCNERGFVFRKYRNSLHSQRNLRGIVCLGKVLRPVMRIYDMYRRWESYWGVAVVMIMGIRRRFQSMVYTLS